MSIPYEDLKSDFLQVPLDSCVEFEIMVDPMKIEKISDKDPLNPKKYFMYEFKVKASGTVDLVKFSVFKNQLKDMTDGLGKPETLVGTKWRRCRQLVDGKETWTLDSIKDFRALPSVGLS